MSLTNAAADSKLFETLYPKGYNPYRIKWFDLLIAGLITLIVLIAYIRTQAPSVIAGDSGELTTEIYNMGACHPPGYPLYSILGKLFTFIPVGDVAFRVNLYVSISGAFAIFFLYLVMVKLLGLNRDTGKLSLWVHLPAVLTSFIFAFSMDFWQQSVASGKFYSLNVLLVAAMIFVMILWYEEMIWFRREGKLHFAQRTTILLGLMFGLSITVHQLPLWFIIAFIFVLAAAILIVISDRNERFKQEFEKRIPMAILTLAAHAIAFILIMVFAVGNRMVPPMVDYRGEFHADLIYILIGILIVPVFLTSYTILVKLARFEENWFDKFLETYCIAFWMLFFGLTIYLYLVARAVALAPLPDPKPLSWGDTQTLDILINHMLRKQYGMGGGRDYDNLLGQLSVVADVTVKQFSWPLIVVSLAGLVYMAIKEKIWAIYSALAIIISYGMLIYFINFDVDPRTISIQKQYFCQLHMIFAVFMGFGFQMFLDLTKLKPKKLAGPDEQALTPGGDKTA